MGKDKRSRQTASAPPSPLFEKREMDHLRAVASQVAGSEERAKRLSAILGRRVTAEQVKAALHEE